MLEVQLELRGVVGIQKYNKQSREIDGVVLGKEKFNVQGCY